ncbi:MAG TPA: LLM class flavin-dependent oxidoreductase [Micromonosporaceae bacterium]|nr:LLM class flavin-dependent oxidoreductase [Micromonosporaceae bacterium]
MDIGLSLGFGKLDPAMTDEDLYRGEVALGLRAEELGFDSVFVVEHHFADYGLCPDNFLILAYLASRTTTVKLGTAAVIVPWNNPLRVAEKALMLDTLSGGRMQLGLGRGLARRECEPFNVTLEETRARFDEAAPMIFEALETGVMEGDGPFYPQPRVPLRPVPQRSFMDRRYVVAGSPDSIATAARLRARMMSFITRPVEHQMAEFTRYRTLYEELHGQAAPPISLTINMYCHRDHELARERHFEYVNRFFLSNVEHYEMAGDHFATTKGYERYAVNAERLRDTGLVKAAELYAATALWGTPDHILGQIEAIRDVLGDFELGLVPACGGMPYDQARDSLELFGREVLPRARELGRRPAGVRAEAVAAVPGADA